MCHGLLVTAASPYTLVDCAQLKCRLWEEDKDDGSLTMRKTERRQPESVIRPTCTQVELQVSIFIMAFTMIYSGAMPIVQR